MIKIKLDKFEGPLSLLLKLIEGEELDITEISLARVADQYVEYIRKADIIDPAELADFLVVATRLILIKSKALLPYLYPEEKQEIEEFEQQLKMYKEFVEASREIEQRLKEKHFMFAREFNRQAFLANTNFFAPPKKLRSKDLKAVFKDLLARLKPIEKLEEEMLDYKISLEEKIVHIQKMMINRIKISFSRLLSRARGKTEIIVNFLAILELEKQRDVRIDQEGLFEDILIQKK